MRARVPKKFENLDLSRRDLSRLGGNDAACNSPRVAKVSVPSGSAEAAGVAAITVEATAAKSGL